MKTVILITLLISVNIPAAKPDSKLIVLFTQTFPTAENVKWHADANGYAVFFKLNGITTRIYYDAREKFAEEERYYDEKNLPAYILIAIRKKYPDKKICGVTELINSSSTYYQVNLKDDKNLYIIKVSADASIELVRSFANADDFNNH